MIEIPNYELVINFYKEIADEKAKRLAKESRKSNAGRAVPDTKRRTVSATLEEIKCKK